MILNGEMMLDLAPLSAKKYQVSSETWKFKIQFIIRVLAFEIQNITFYPKNN